MADNNNKTWELINHFFDKVLILTIDRNKNRTDILTDVFNGLNYELFRGVDGSKLVIQDLINRNIVDKSINEIFVNTSALHMNMNVQSIHNNEVACALSHKNIYQYVIDNDLQSVLIFEDDVIPVYKNLQYLEQSLKELPKDWDILYLGYKINDDFSVFGNIKYNYLPSFLFQIGIKTPGIVRKINGYPKKYSKMIRRYGAHTCTHAYAISNKAAKKLVKIQEPLKYVADLLLMDTISKKELTSYTTTFPFFDQNSSIDSSIWGK